MFITPLIIAGLMSGGLLYGIHHHIKVRFKRDDDGEYWMEAALEQQQIDKENKDSKATVRIIEHTDGKYYVQEELKNNKGEKNYYPINLNKGGLDRASIYADQLHGERFDTIYGTTSLNEAKSVKKKYIETFFSDRPLTTKVKVVG